MSTIAVQPFQMGDCTFTVETDNYTAHVSQVEFTPSTTTTTWKGLTPSSIFQFAGRASWVCALSYAQDWTTEDSLSQYLHDHEGESVAVELVPVDGGPTVSATLTVVPGAIGGTVDQTAVATVSLPVSGKPVITPAA